MLIIKNKAKVLTIAAHPDDIELSCGGTLLKLIEQYQVTINSIVCSRGELKSKPNIRMLEQKKANKYLHISESIFLNCKDGFIVPDGYLVGQIEQNIKSFKPDLIFTHWQDDVHQDHRSVAWATMSAARRSQSSILSYPSLFTRDKFIPNLFVDITEYMKKKLELLSVFKSQIDNDYLSQETIKIRAKEAGLYSNCTFAEQFSINFGVL